jgi:hypothetical protein
VNERSAADAANSEGRIFYRLCGTRRSGEVYINSAKYQFGENARKMVEGNK